jgi:MFS family permease
LHRDVFGDDGRLLGHLQLIRKLMRKPSSKPLRRQPARWAAITGLLYNVGAIAGYLAAGFLADTIGRKPVDAFFAGSLLATPLVYL